MSVFKIGYSTRQNVPRFNQLNPVVDNSLPSRIYLGNLYLKSEYAHTATFSYKKTGVKKYTHLLKLTGSCTQYFIGDHLYMPKSDITISGITVRKGTQFLTYENLGNALKVNFTVSHERNISKIKYGFNYGYTFDQLPNKLNDLISKTVINRYNFGVHTNYYPNPLLLFTNNFYGSYGLVNNLINESKNNKLLNWGLNSNFRYLFFKSMLVELELNAYQVVNISQSNSDDARAILNFSLKQELFKKKMLSIQFHIHDIFNKSLDITQNPSAVFITRVEKKMLGRYFLIGLAIKF